MNASTAFSLALRWTSRAIGGLILAFVLLHLVAEGMPDIESNSLGEAFLWGGFLTCLLGLVLLWKWELVGGILAMLGMVLFFIANFAISGTWPLGWVMLLCFVPGILAILSWFFARRQSYN